MVEEELAELRKVFERLSNDFRDACISWSIWEAGNGYPIGEKRETLRKSANMSGEGHHIRTIQNLAFVSTLLSLCRMMDSVGNGRGNDRMSLGRVALTIQNKELQSFLLSKVDSRGVCLHNFVSIEATREHLIALQVLLGHDAGHPKNLASMRRHLKELRDNWLAHSLIDPPPSKVTANLVRDGMIFSGMSIRRGWLVLCGTNWNPRDSWRRSLKDAQSFWNRHESGFT